MRHIERVQRSRRHGWKQTREVHCSLFACAAPFILGGCPDTGGTPAADLPDVSVVDTAQTTDAPADSGAGTGADSGVFSAAGAFSGARTTWSNASANLNGELNWRLSDGSWLEINRADWAPTGTESVTVDPEVLPDGQHLVHYTLAGAGRSANVKFGIDLLDYEFAVAGLVQGDTERVVHLDILDGHVLPLFNGWLAADAPGAGGVTGRYPLEALSGWRDATGGYHAELNLRLPSGDFLEVSRADWALQGMERIAVVPETPLTDGDYTLWHRSAGAGRSAQVAFEVSLLGARFDSTSLMLGEQERIIGFDVSGGAANVLFNGWLAADADGAGGLTPGRALQVIGAWRDGQSEGVHVDIHVRLPSGDFLDPRRMDWGGQGYEHACLPGDVLPSGVYELWFDLEGAGRTGRITYQARVLNWEFKRTELMLGDSPRRVIRVQVQNGVASLISSTW